MIALIDNYDSFTYNLYQYIGEINTDISVFRNDRIGVEKLRALKPSHIVISPGPGFPKDAGISTKVIRELSPCIPILGVCLGHQAIGEAFGGKVVHADELMHGKASEIKVDNTCEVFKGLGERIKAGRYHSLIVEKNSLPEELKITALSEGEEIMGLRHVKYPVYGIQFHPESILTPAGKRILKNFFEIM